MSDAIVLEHVTRDFGRVRALDDLTLRIPAGTIFGFLGPNGAGKTTTIRLLLGLLAPTRGRVAVLGLDPRRDGDAVRANTGALLERSGVYRHLTAEENLEFYGRVAGLDPAERRSRIRTLLGDLGLWERRGDRAGSWSRGMRQKLALARVLLHRPTLILLDEPTAGLDVMAAHEVRDRLEQLASEWGATIFLTTHNMAEAERLCSHVAVLRDGMLMTQGRPDDLRTRAERPRIEIVGRGFGPDVLRHLRAAPNVGSAEVSGDRMIIELHRQAPTASLVSLLVAAGAEVEEVRRDRASLEDVFLTLMEEGS